MTEITFSTLGESRLLQAEHLLCEVSCLERKKEREREEASMAPEPEDEIKDEKNPRPLDDDDIALLKTYVSIRPL